MFIKIGNKWLNERNISFIEVGEQQFKVHMVNNENAPLSCSASNYADTSYHDMKVWLAKQETQSPELART